ncbi:hypothetical protein C8J57DRAFT_1586001 [Mycena rebaudengoi]|nr:hypothetical protein C8J57DRAFT_1586001 [Mycena rebaudengoi]
MLDPNYDTGGCRIKYNTRGESGSSSQPTLLCSADESKGESRARAPEIDIPPDRDGYAASPDDIFLTAGASGGISLISLLITDPTAGILIPISKHPLYVATLGKYHGRAILYLLDESGTQSISPTMAAARKAGTKPKALVDRLLLTSEFRGQERIPCPFMRSNWRPSAELLQQREDEAQGSSRRSSTANSVHLGRAGLGSLSGAGPCGGGAEAFGPAEVLEPGGAKVWLLPPAEVWEPDAELVFGAPPGAEPEPLAELPPAPPSSKSEEIVGVLLSEAAGDHTRLDGGGEGGGGAEAGRLVAVLYAHGASACSNAVRCTLESALLLRSQVAVVLRNNVGRENKSREDKSEDGEHYGVGDEDKGMKKANGIQREENCSILPFELTSGLT